jgi:hypothetical protein
VVDDLAELDRRIAGALDVLRGVRALSAQSPTPETLRQERLAEYTLNLLLDRRPRCQMRQQARLLAG